MAFEECEGNDSMELATQLGVLNEVMGDLCPRLDAPADIQELHEISQLVNDRMEAWDADVAAKSAELDNLQAALQRARDAAQRPAGTPSAEEHEASVRRLTEEQYAAHKNLNEEEAQTSRCDGELARLRSEREDVKQLRVEDKGENHAQVLRLGLFGGMGFSVLDEKPPKILVRNDGSNDVHTVTVLDASKRVHYANLLWDLAS